MHFQIVSLLAPIMRPHYYLDPGSGSFLVQLLIAAIAGGGLIIATSWKRIKGFFTRSKTMKEDEIVINTKKEDETKVQQ